MSKSRGSSESPTPSVSASPTADSRGDAPSSAAAAPSAVPAIAGAVGGVAVLGPFQTQIQHLNVSGANGQGRDVWQPGAALVWLDADVAAADVTLHGAPDIAAAVRVVGGKWRGERVTSLGAAVQARCSGGASIVLDGAPRPCTDAQEAAP